MQRRYLLVFLCLLLLTGNAMAVGGLAWGENGAAIGITGSSLYPVIVSSEAGGAIVAWVGNNGDEIQASGISSSGTTLWTTIILSSDLNATCDGLTIADGGDGAAILAWYDGRSGTDEVYVQKVGPDGVLSWALNGVGVRTGTGVQSHCRLVGDGNGGAIVVWHESVGQTSWDIYAQRIDSNGDLLWGNPGVVVCDETSGQLSPQITANADGDIFVFWTDFRAVGISEIYGQQLDPSNGSSVLANDGIVVATGLSADPTQLSLAATENAVYASWAEKSSDDPNEYKAMGQKMVNAVRQWGNAGQEFADYSDFRYPRVLSLSSGGVLLYWGNENAMPYTGSVQRTDSSNDWGPSVVSGMSFAEAVNDGEGGVFVYGNDASEATETVVQRINSSGEAMWSAPVRVSSLDAGSYSANPRHRIALSDAGAVLCAFTTLGNRVYAQKIVEGLTTTTTSTTTTTVTTTTTTSITVIPLPPGQVLETSPSWNDTDKRLEISFRTDEAGEVEFLIMNSQGNVVGRSTPQTVNAAAVAAASWREVNVAFEKKPPRDVYIIITKINGVPVAKDHILID